MEATDNKTPESSGSFTNYKDQHPGSGRFLGGLVILTVGVVLLLKQIGTVAFPAWLFTKPLLLIAIGLYLGARHGFRGRGWVILLLIGGIFLAREFYPNLDAWKYIWAILIIAVGLMMMIRPKRRWDWRTHAYWEGKKGKWHRKYENEYGGTPGSKSSSENDYIDSVSVFGGVHKIVVSKDFKGGDVVNIFGGSEINLSQADINGVVNLDVVQLFGGSKIIVPADWTIQSKMVSIFGGIEDKRLPAMLKPNPGKVLIIEGTSIFAGMEIMSY